MEANKESRRKQERLRNQKEMGEMVNYYIEKYPERIPEKARERFRHKPKY